MHYLNSKIRKKGTLTDKAIKCNETVQAHLRTFENEGLDFGVFKLWIKDLRETV